MPDIVKLANIFYKLAQSQQAIINHAIRIEQQARLLADRVIAGIQVGTTRPEARSYADALRNFAIQYRQNLQQNTLNEQAIIYYQMIEMYNAMTLYVDKEYDPMKQINQSLMYLSQLQKNTELSPVQV